MAEDIYRCDSCGGIMEFDVAAQTLKCPNCGNTVEIKKNTAPIVEHNLTLDAERKIKAEEKKSTTMICSGCGAHIEVSANDTAAVCPYCGSSYVLAEKQEETLIPDGVVPFKIDKNEVGVKFRTWMKRRWLAPNELKNLYQSGSFQGIYAPYWTFDADCECEYTAQGGRCRQESYTDSKGEQHTRTVTDWYYVRGHISHFFDDIAEPASNRFRKGLFSGIEPFQFNQLESYSPDYISGYLSENYSINLEDGHKEAVDEMQVKLREMASSEVLRRYDRVRDIIMMPRFSNETYKYLLLPVYSTAYSYKNKNYTVVVNGQTGKIKGDYPKSPAKIAAIVILCVLIIAGIFFFSNKNKEPERAAFLGSANTAVEMAYEENTCDLGEKFIVQNFEPEDFYGKKFVCGNPAQIYRLYKLK